MKVLILTQVVDETHSNLGFFCGWIKTISKQVDSLTVICLERGQHNLPENVNILSLGKEEGCSRLKYIARLYRYVWRERKNYDAVLVHMNHIYVLLCGILWRLQGKRIVLWYAHGCVPWNLPLALFLANAVATSTSSGFRLASGKVHVIGQAIDTDIFLPRPERLSRRTPTLLYVGRIARIKHLETIISAADILVQSEHSLSVLIAGAPLTEDDTRYQDELVAEIATRNITGYVEFVGPLVHNRVANFLQNGDILVNTSTTGSLDKTMAEAMACGVPVVTCNVAYQEVFGAGFERYFFEAGNAQALARQIARYLALTMDEKEKISKIVRTIVLRDHNIIAFSRKIAMLLRGEYE